MITGEVSQPVPYLDEAGSPKTLDKKMEEYVEGDNKIIIVKDLYGITAGAFKNVALVALYVLAMFAIAFHLFHGFKSGFQTLGLNHPRYNPAIRFLSLWVFAIIIPALFAAMPLYFFLVK